MASNSRETNADLKKASALDRVAERLLTSIDPAYKDQRFLSDQDAEFQKIIDRQLDIAKGVAGGQVVDFIGSLRNSQKKQIGRPSKNNTMGIETADLFTENIGDIFGYFQDIYKNRFMEVADLKFISKFIPSIGESVRIYIDAIVSSDDVSQTVTRKINLPSAIDRGDEKTVMTFIENMEERHKLLAKLKVAYKKTLVSGSFFVYHIAYRDLFAQYSHGLASGQIARDGSHRMGGNARQGSQQEPHHTPPAPSGKMPKPGKHNALGIAQESAMLVTDIENEPGLEAFGEEAQYLARDGLISKCTFSVAIENFMGEIGNLAANTQLPRNSKGDQYTAKEYTEMMRKAIENDLPNIYFNHSEIPFDVVNDASNIVEAGLESDSPYHKFFNLRKGEDESIDAANKTEIADGTFDINSRSGRSQNFDGISGTYLKWIDYKYMLPIEVLGQRIGYYHIITTPKSKKKGNGRGSGKPTEVGGILSTGSMSLFDQMDVSEKRKEAAIQNIVDSISDSILNQFGAKFVKKNAAFRELIAECIIANGLVNNDYMIQFIPVDQVIEFKCNEDETGKGESILSDAMFPAHLLLSIVISKMLNYINKGGNRTVAHISSGRVNRQLSNQVNRVIRDLQAGNVTFTDLLSSSMVFSKVTRDSNIAMPKDQQGNRLVEFEVQEGQQIDLNTEYESMLEKWCMTATGIPPSVMDYESNVDVAKKVVSDNIRVAGRVASLQSDFEPPTTELYRCLIRDSDLDDSVKAQIVNALQFKLPRPRILANQNNSEALNTAFQNAQTIASIMIGEDANEPQDQKRKAKFIEKIVRQEVPFIQWNQMDDLLRKVDTELADLQTKENAKKAMNTGSELENPDDSLNSIDSF